MSNTSRKPGNVQDIIKGKITKNINNIYKYQDNNVKKPKKGKKSEKLQEQKSVNSTKKINNNSTISLL